MFASIASVMNLQQTKKHNLLNVLLSYNRFQKYKQKFMNFCKNTIFLPGRSGGGRMSTVSPLNTLLRVRKNIPKMTRVEPAVDAL